MILDNPVSSEHHHQGTHKRDRRAFHTHVRRGTVTTVEEIQVILTQARVHLWLWEPEGARDRVSLDGDLTLPKPWFTLCN